jgi:futalosine hydrolase
MILLVSATSFEIQPTINWIEKQNLASKIKVLISGVGSPATMYATMKCIAEEKPELIIQAGIAGSFNPKIIIGDVVIVETEQWCDLGIENHDEFQSLFDMQFTKPNELPYSNGIIECKYQNINGIEKTRKVRAVTSNTAHGNQISIDKIVKKYNPDIETMEGAAIAYICAMENIPFLQIRSISNIVEPRNRDAWNIPLAIINLNKILQKALYETL